jgi:hypothetical protein
MEKQQEPDRLLEEYIVKVAASLKISVHQLHEKIAYLLSIQEPTAAQRRVGVFRRRRQLPRSRAYLPDERLFNDQATYKGPLKKVKNNDDVSSYFENAVRVLEDSRGKMEDMTDWA